MKKLVLIFYSQGLYDQSAYAINEYMSKYYIDYDIVLVKESKYSNWFNGEFNKNYYITTSRDFAFINKYSQGMREKSFLKSDKKVKLLSQKQLQDLSNNKLIAKRMKVDNIIARYCPTIIICTTPLSHLLVTKTLQRQQWNIPMYILTSDFCLNKAFINPYAQGYFVQNNDVLLDLKNKGVDEKTIKVCPTPIQKSTMTYYDKDEIRTKYGIDNDLPTITLIGGRYGNSYMKEYFSHLSLLANKVNIVVMTGGSVSYVKYVQSYCNAKGIDSNVIIVDKVSNISEIYSLSDIIVTSPTTYVVYEALARKIPCIITKPMNKTEEGNAHYLISNGYALRGETKEIATNSMLNLLNDKEYYQSHIDKLNEKFADDGVKTLCRNINDILLRTEVINSLKRTFDNNIPRNEETDKIIVVKKDIKTE